MYTLKYLSGGESKKGLSTSLLIYTLGPFSLSPLEMKKKECEMFEYVTY